MTATASSPFSAVLERDNGEVVPDFPLEIEGPDTTTVAIPLDPGTYLLRVSAPASWNVTVVLVGS